MRAALAQAKNWGKLRFEVEHLSRYQSEDSSPLRTGGGGNEVLAAKSGEWNLEDLPSERISEFRAHQLQKAIGYTFLAPDIIRHCTLCQRGRITFVPSFISRFTRPSNSYCGQFLAKKTSLHLKEDYFFIDTEIVVQLHRAGFRYIQKGVRHYPRTAGKSTVGPTDVPPYLSSPHEALGKAAAAELG